MLDLSMKKRGMKITEYQRGIKLIRKSTDGDQCLIPQLNVFLRGMKITEYQRGIKLIRKSTDRDQCLILRLTTLKF